MSASGSVHGVSTHDPASRGGLFAVGYVLALVILGTLFGVLALVTHFH